MINMNHQHHSHPSANNHQFNQAQLLPQQYGQTVMVDSSMDSGHKNPYYPIHHMGSVAAAGGSGSNNGSSFNHMQNVSMANPKDKMTSGNEYSRVKSMESGTYSLMENLAKRDANERQLKFENKYDSMTPRDNRKHISSGPNMRQSDYDYPYHNMQQSAIASGYGLTQHFNSNHQYHQRSHPSQQYPKPMSGIRNNTNPHDKTAMNTTAMGSITPTVNINSLAMKHGLEAKYILKDVQNFERPAPYVHQQTHFDPLIGGYQKQGNQSAFNNQNVRYSNGKQYFAAGMVPEMSGPSQISSYSMSANRNYKTQKPKLYTVVLQMSGQEFEGQGKSRQQARHMAAAKALEHFEKHPPERVERNEDGTCNESSGGAPQRPKSDISLVYEIAHRLNLSVCFEESCAESLPNIRIFTVKCKVGEHVAEGQANGKKNAHRAAASRMLEILNELNVPPPRPKHPLLTNRQKKKPSKAEKVENEFNNALNPISRLVQIIQGHKYSSPVFVVKSEFMGPWPGRRSRQFHVEVVVGDKRSEGVGSNKKIAKKIAAINMLQSMGYSVENMEDPSLKRDMQGESGDDYRPKDGSYKGFHSSSYKTNFRYIYSQRRVTDRQNAITIAKEFVDSPDTTSETALKLLAENDVEVDEQYLAKDGSLTATQKMKLLCLAINAPISFHDVTKMGPPVEHVTGLQMTLGHTFEVFGSAPTSEEARQKASQSALTSIANADPSGSPDMKEQHVVEETPVAETTEKQSEEQAADTVVASQETCDKEDTPPATVEESKVTEDGDA